MPKHMCWIIYHLQKNFSIWNIQMSHDRLYLLSEATNSCRVMFFISSSSFSYSATWKYLPHKDTCSTSMLLLHTWECLDYSVVMVYLYMCAYRKVGGGARAPIFQCRKIICPCRLLLLIIATCSFKKRTISSSIYPSYIRWCYKHSF
jgi:hypothetical protein